MSSATFMLGCICGLAAAIYLTYVSRRDNAEAYFGAVIDAPCMGSIPAFAIKFFAPSDPVLLYAYMGGFALLGCLGLIVGLIYGGRYLRSPYS